MGYWGRVRRSVRILTIVLLAAFAAGSVAHAASATVMDVTMALAGAGGTDMPECDGCADGDDNPPPCNGLCVAPLLAMSNPGPILHPVVDAQTGDASTHDVVGRTGPPDPSPPRTIVLN